MKNLFLLFVSSIQLCYFSLVFASSYEETIRYAEQGHANAQVKLGAMYNFCKGVQLDYHQAK